MFFRKPFTDRIIWIAFFLLSALTGFGNDCNPPFFLLTTEPGVHSAQLNWIQTPAEALWLELELYQDGQDPAGAPLRIEPADRLLIDTLQPATLYYARIRAVCQDSVAGEWSNRTRFRTDIPQPSPCQFSLPIRDVSCEASSERNFRVQVEQAPGDSLGADVFLREVRLIVEHSWLADLRVVLRNPGGSEVTLVEYRGIDESNFGNPFDDTCERVAIFRDDACRTVAESSPPYVGSYLPESGDLEDFHDLSDPRGIWQLEICDRTDDNDNGVLRYIQFVWAPVSCPAPVVPVVQQLVDTSVVLSAGISAACDSLVAEIGPHGFEPSYPAPAPGAIRKIFTGCQSDSILVGGLESGQEYDLYLYQHCGGSLSYPSCVQRFRTLCGPILAGSQFEPYDPCLPPATCDQVCEIPDPIWKNIPGDDTDWLLHTGSTPTDLTGPGAGLYDHGNYLYYESSNPDCRDGSRTVLQSACLEVLPGTGDCHMSYHAYLDGDDVNKLTLEISLDGGDSWTGIDSMTGQQGDEWIRCEIGLEEFAGQICLLRFVAFGGPGSLGDIGLDGIALHRMRPLYQDVPEYYVDDDGDGYGHPDSSRAFCRLDIPAGFSQSGTDCDDGNDQISPAAQEIPCNLIDENCNGMDDDNVQADPLRYQLVGLEEVSCAGLNDGSIEISVEGGLPPYEYQWNTGQDSAYIGSLPPGIYYCVVTDAEGCLLQTAFYELKATEIMIFLLSEEVRPSCSTAEDGELTVLTGGGDPPYSYTWNTGDTTQSIDDLAQGLYQLTVTDGNGCIFQSPPYQLDAEEPIRIAAVDIDPVSCFGEADGEIYTFVFGGNGPLQYKWSHGDSTDNVQSLESGYYHLTVIDQDSCTAMRDSIFVPQPAPLEFRISVLDPPSCYGLEDGRIQIHITGGSAQYTATWFDGHTTTYENDLLNIGSGYYDLTISDNEFCSIVEDSIYLSSPEPIGIELDSLRNISCPLLADGYLAVSTRGNEDYQFAWSHGRDTGRMADDLAPGSYNVTVTDPDGCSEVSDVYELGVVDEPLFTGTLLLDNIRCFGDGNGALVGSAESGTPPFRFSWSSGTIHAASPSTDTIRHLGPGTYSFTVTDQYGCSGTSNPIELQQPPLLRIDGVERQHPNCHGSKDGSLTLSVLGGVPPYQAMWSDGLTGLERDSLSAGSFAVEVSDQNGCLVSRGNIFLTEPDSTVIMTEITDAHPQQSDGAIRFQVFGPNPPYRLIYEDNILAQFESVWSWEDIPSGAYGLEILDDNGCIYPFSVEVGTITATIDISEGGWRVYPNPFGEIFYIEFPPSSNRFQSDRSGVRLFSIAGREIPVETRLSDGVLRVKVQDVMAGLYFLEVKEQGVLKAVIPMVRDH